MAQTAYWVGVVIANRSLEDGIGVERMYICMEYGWSVDGMWERREVLYVNLR